MNITGFVSKVELHLMSHNKPRNTEFYKQGNNKIHKGDFRNTGDTHHVDTLTFVCLLQVVPNMVSSL